MIEKALEPHLQDCDVVIHPLPWSVILYVKMPI